MTITLTQASPTATQTGLTAGASYSVWHRGGITISTNIGGTPTPVYSSPPSAGALAGSVVLSGIPQTSLVFELAADETSAAAELTAIYQP
jgi:hypothetical protein